MKDFFPLGISGNAKAILEKPEYSTIAAAFSENLLLMSYFEKLKFSGKNVISGK
jgi:hypothetical protein